MPWNFDALVIGASAGGVEALQAIARSLPADLGAAVMVVLHLPPDRPSGLAELLAPQCALPVAEALHRAEEGVYALERMAQFSRNYLAAGGRGSLSDHYTSAYGGAKFDPALRRQVVFADHSLATDSVFSEVHLVSCRNVLIYFNTTLQDRAVGLFKDSLVHRGFLGLGSKETLQFGAHALDFEAVNAGARIYRRL